MLIDILVISFSYVLAWAIRFVGPFANTAVRAKSFRDFMLLLLLIIPGYLLLYQAFSLYTPLRMQGRRLVLSNVIQANTLGLLIIIAILYVIEEHDYSRLTFFIFYVINVILECGFRMTVFYILRNLRKKGYNQKQVLLVGYSRAAGEYIERIKENPQWGYVVRGILDDNVPAGTEYRGVKVLGRIANLMVILPNSNLDEIAITLGLNEYYRLEEIVVRQLQQTQKANAFLKWIIGIEYRQRLTLARQSVGMVFHLGVQQSAQSFCQMLRHLPCATRRAEIVYFDLCHIH